VSGLTKTGGYKVSDRTVVFLTSNAEMKASTQESLTADLCTLGVEPGDVIMVHSSLRAIGPIEGRAGGLVSALLASVGKEGSLMSYVDFQPTQDRPYFDPTQSTARPDYGVFAEILRTWPGAVRSLNPGASMAAIGAKAEWLCANHPLDYGYGPGSPLDKLTQVGGKILLLGSDWDQVTILHFAEHVAPLPGKRVVRRTYEILDQGGSRKSQQIEEFDTSNPVLNTMPKDVFRQIISEFIKQGRSKSGTVGRAVSQLIPAKQLVDFAVGWMVTRYGT
jgi:aminoglycoside 3-N-acetyltransferase